MAKPKPNLAGVLDDLPPAPPAATLRTSIRRRAPRNAPPEEAPETVLVGANLPPTYARNLAMLHAETGKSKKELVQQALDMLFTSMGGPRLKI